MPEVANGINTWKKSSTCFWLPLESFIKIVLTLFSLFVELECQQPHDQDSDQQSDNSQKYSICLDCSRQSHLDQITSSGLCSAEGVSVLGRQGHTPARNTAFLEQHSAGKRKQKCLLFTTTLCSCSGDFSIPFLLPQGAHIGSVLSGQGVTGTPQSLTREPIGARGTPTADEQPTSHYKKCAWKSGSMETGGNIVFCVVKVVGTYCQKIVPTTECPFIWRERKDN